MYEHKNNLIPNSTQVPNVILDLVIPRLPEAEGRCLLYICRRTFGFHKESDRISFSQFIDGIKDRTGKVLDYGAGLARASVAKGLKNLAQADAVIVRTTTKGNFYQINLSMDVDKVVQLVNQYSGNTKSGSATRPKAVQVVNTQNLGNKEKESNTQSVTALPKKERSLHSRLVEYFHNTAKQTRGISVAITKADGKNLKRVIDTNTLTEDDLEKLILYFLGSGHFRNLSPSISTFLSATVLNGLVDNMRNNPRFWKELDDLTQRFKYIGTKENKAMIERFEALKKQFLEKLIINKTI